VPRILAWHELRSDASRPIGSNQNGAPALAPTVTPMIATSPRQPVSAAQFNTAAPLPRHEGEQGRRYPTRRRAEDDDQHAGTCEHVDAWRVDLPAVATFLTFAYLPGTETLVEGVAELLPGRAAMASIITVGPARAAMDSRTR
jgi:hypothetical protein